MIRNINGVIVITNKLPDGARERVDTLIQRVMKQYPGEHGKYYQAVHQELAPHARELESALDAEKKRGDALWQECENLRIELNLTRKELEKS